MAKQEYQGKTGYDFDGNQKKADTTEQVLSFFSRGWSSFTNTIKTVVEEPKVQEVFQKVKHQVDVIIADDEDDKAREAEKKKLESVLAPWEDFTVADPKAADEITKNILAIAQERRNLLNAPPDIEGFKFDFDIWLPVAMVSLEKDPELSRARFELVPKRISEKEFWKNYFMRVFIVKQAYGVEMLTPRNLAPPPAEAAAAAAAESASVAAPTEASKATHTNTTANIPSPSSLAAADSSSKPNPTSAIGGESILSSNSHNESVEFASEYYDLEADPTIEELKISLGDADISKDGAPASTNATGVEDGEDELELGESLTLEEELRKELEQDL